MPLFIIITTIILIICSILYFPTIKVKNITISSYWPISLIGALLLLLTNSIPIDLIIDAFTANNSMNPIKILVLFISMTILSIFLDEVGFFRYVANKAIKVGGKVGGKIMNPLKTACFQGVSLVEPRGVEPVTIMMGCANHIKCSVYVIEIIMQII